MLYCIERSTMKVCPFCKNTHYVEGNVCYYCHNNINNINLAKENDTIVKILVEDKYEKGFLNKLNSLLGGSESVYKAVIKNKNINNSCDVIVKVPNKYHYYELSTHTWGNSFLNFIHAVKSTVEIVKGNVRVDDLDLVCFERVTEFFVKKRFADKKNGKP